MALSPAQRHSAMIRAERALECRQALAGRDSLHLQVRALENDLARLKALPRTAERIDLKRDELLPRWMPTVENYLAAGEVHAHPVFAWCVIWLFDVGDFDRALNWADIAIAQRQPTPETIRRGFAPFVADTVLAWAEEEASRGHALEPYFSRTFANVRAHWRLHEEISAKWFKFAGLLLLRDEKGEVRATAVDDAHVLEEADALLAQAHAFHPQGGGGQDPPRPDSRPPAGVDKRLNDYRPQSGRGGGQALRCSRLWKPVCPLFSEVQQCLTATPPTTRTRH